MKILHRYLIELDEINDFRKDLEKFVMEHKPLECTTEFVDSICTRVLDSIIISIPDSDIEIVDSFFDALPDLVYEIKVMINFDPDEDLDDTFIVKILDLSNILLDKINKIIKNRYKEQVYLLEKLDGNRVIIGLADMEYKLLNRF